MIKKPSLMTDSNFPMFVRGNSDYDMLRRFVQSYFESLEVSEGASHEVIHGREHSDVDLTTIQFLDRFYETFYPTLPKTVKADKRLLLKHTRELYQKKGTPESFKLLFRIVFNEFVSLKYPSENILRASDGRWQQSAILHVALPALSIPIESLVGAECIAVNRNGTIRNYIENVKIIDKINGIYEVAIDTQKNTRYLVGDRIRLGSTVVGTIMPVPNKVNVIVPGEKFKVGQLIHVKTATASGTYAKVTSTTLAGGIKHVKLIKFGTGYESAIHLTLDPYANLALGNSVTPPSLSGTTLPINESGNGFNESGKFIFSGRLGNDYDYFLEDYVSPYNYTGHVIRQFESVTPPRDDVESTKNYAIIQVEVGAVARYPGAWKTSDGKISDPLIRLQDNALYQNYSYIVRSPVPRTSYEKIVRKTIHPAGLVMFSEMVLDSTFDVSAAIEDQLGTKLRMYLNDLVDIPDVHAVKMTTPKFDDQVVNDIATYAPHGYFEESYTGTVGNPYEGDPVQEDIYKKIRHPEFDTATPAEENPYSPSYFDEVYTEDEPITITLIEHTLPTLTLDTAVSVDDVNTPYSPSYVDDDYVEPSDGISIRLN